MSELSHQHAGSGISRRSWIVEGLCALAAFAAVASAGLPLAARAQATAWPERAITLIQPYAPGTATDASSRFIAQKIGERWKVPLVMDSSPWRRSVWVWYLRWLGGVGSG